MATRSDLLDRGLNVLAEHGHPALADGRLHEHLGTEPGTGSFGEHFDGEAEFHDALLEHVEARYTNGYIDHADGTAADRDQTPDPTPDPAATARDRLSRLADAILSDNARPDLEIAMRAWARHHPEARAMQERIDRRRMEYVRGLLTEATGDPQRAEQLARLMYLVLVGARQVVPPASREELRGYFDLVLASIQDADAR